MIHLYTIGFTKKTAETFFNLIRKNEIRLLLDTRLNTKSQLAGFAKSPDLAFLLKELCNAEYQYEPSLAPTQEMLSAYRKNQMSWPSYESHYRKLLADRAVHEKLDPALFDKAVLLCSEAAPENCHRRLAAEHLANAWTGVKITHLQ